jgi:hypothetical protein
MAHDLTAPASQTFAGEHGAVEQSADTAITPAASTSITPVASLAEVLNSTLKAIERREALRPDDPALAELRHSVLRLLTELEVLKSEARASNQQQPA